MNFEILKDFEFFSKVPEDVIEKYKDKIPPELLEIWQVYGFGSFANGYIKIVNPDDYIEILEESYFASKVSIAVFATGFGDIITLHKGEFVGVVKYRKSTVELYPFEFTDFLLECNTPDNEDISEFLDNDQYSDAVNLFGKLKYDECFGYVPLLALGGSEDPEYLQKLKVIPHICLITDIAGRIE